ncbi:Uncharacterised protein [Escherichia coli]|nr:Uncharacterised protein [Escherichia coli]CAD6181857.1 Uncharacterised protein [Escherichia coli]
MLGGADNPNGELLSYIIGADIVVKLHDIAGKFASLRGRFSFTGFS